jgi:hypothetical protein
MGTVRMFMPAFRNRPKAAGVVGRILAGYGDLELMLSQLAGMAIASKRRRRPTHTIPQHRIYYEHIGLQKLFSMKGGDDRIRKVRLICRGPFVQFGLQEELRDLLTMVDKCRRYRNLFSHCLWARSKHRGLFFVDLEEHAKQPGLLQFKYRYASQTALEEIEMYNWLTVQWIGNTMDLFVIKAGLSRHHVALTMPKRPVLKEHGILLPYKDLH